MKNILFLFSILALTACAQSQPNKVEGLPENVKSYGEVIEAKDVMSTPDLMAKVEKMADTDSLDCTLNGIIQETCVKKGCWMTVDIEAEEEMRVRFKDYGFFVPKEGQSGNKTVMHGKAFKSVTSVADLQHYAEDAGKSKEEIAKISEPEVSVSFLADGVLIYESE